jgi:hypothetical protein
VDNAAAPEREVFPEHEVTHAYADDACPLQASSFVESEGLFARLVQKEQLGNSSPRTTRRSRSASSAILPSIGQIRQALST